MCTLQESVVLLERLPEEGLEAAQDCLRCTLITVGSLLGKVNCVMIDCALAACINHGGSVCLDEYVVLDYLVQCCVDWICGVAFLVQLGSSSLTSWDDGRSPYKSSMICTACSSWTCTVTKCVTLGYLKCAFKSYTFHC